MCVYVCMHISTFVVVQLVVLTLRRLKLIRKRETRMIGILMFLVYVCVYVCTSAIEKTEVAQRLRERE